MTIDEAKEFLQIDIHCADKGDEEDLRQAMDMAIEALQSISALSADLKAVDRNSMSEEVLIGFNMAVALMNKHLGGDAE